MTKTLSEQLCEICGIEPRYGLYINVGDFDPNYRLVTNERKYRLIADYRYCTPEEELKNLEPKYLPDFTKPENFVKLLKIAHQYLYFTTISQEETFVNGYLRYLINGLDLNNANGRFYYSEEIKQAIREADWVWE